MRPELTALALLGAAGGTAGAGRDGTPGNPPGTAAGRAAGRALGTDATGANPGAGGPAK